MNLVIQKRMKKTKDTDITRGISPFIPLICAE